jgi:DNA helicase-2/ATP-dependent DNA helicase PcrA
VEETGILRLLKEENTNESLTRRENIQELISALTEFNDHRPSARLEDFLEEVALVSDIDTTNFGRNAVTMMTVHSAKGLEFPVVCITGLEEGMFPLMGSLDSEKEIEEERRLMYVGMTRAREVLHLFHAVSRYRFGELSFMVRSRFLDEVDSTLVRTARVPDRAHGTAFRHGAYGTARRRAGSPRPRHSEPEVFSEDGDLEQSLQPRVGLRVSHSAFGRGRIVAIQGKGEGARAVVDFESVGRKQLLLKYAGLTTE